MANIVAICISEKKGVGKTQIEEINLIEEFGLENDAHGGKWHRQVSLLEKEKIEDFIARGGKVKYGDFGENFVTEGIDLEKIQVGDKITIRDSLLEITQKGIQCHVKCNIFKMVGDCIMPKNGVFARVLKGGHVKIGEEIQLINE